jgi:hypothetical protein
MKDTDHHMRHPRGHLGDRTSAQGTRGCAWRDDQFGRGQDPVLGWSDPTFGHGSVPKSESWVAPAQQEDSLGARGVNFGEASEEGRNYALQLRLHHLLLLAVCLSSGKNEEIDERRIQKVTQKKTPDWAGATPLFRLSAAQKVRGVAPAPLRGKRDRVLFACPAEAVPQDRRNYFLMATHCCRIELDKLIGGNRLFSRRQKWLNTPITS